MRYFYLRKIFTKKRGNQVVKVNLNPSVNIDSFIKKIKKEDLREFISREFFKLNMDSNPITFEKEKNKWSSDGFKTDEEVRSYFLNLIKNIEISQSEKSSIVFFTLKEKDKIVDLIEKSKDKDIALVDVVFSDSKTDNISSDNISSLRDDKSSLSICFGKEKVDMEVVSTRESFLAFYLFVIISSFVNECFKPI